MIYGINGDALQSVYDVGGDVLTEAYDVAGNQVDAAEGDRDYFVCMTYNVGQWYCGYGTVMPEEQDAIYYPLQNGILSKHKPDLLCCQEYGVRFSPVRTTASMLDQYFDYTGYGGSGDGFLSMAICSKYSLTNYVRHTFSDESRYYDSAIMTVDGRDVLVITTHLSLTAENRALEVEQLLEFLADKGSFILCGDFNSEGATETGTEEWVSVIKPFLDAGYHVANCTDRYGFLDTYSGDTSIKISPLKLDNIITSADITIRKVLVDQSKTNDLVLDKIDHMPLVAYLAFNNQEALS